MCINKVTYVFNITLPLRTNTQHTYTHIIYRTAYKAALPTKSIRQEKPTGSEHESLCLMLRTIIAYMLCDVRFRSILSGSPYTLRRMIRIYDTIQRNHTTPLLSIAFPGLVAGSCLSTVKPPTSSTRSSRRSFCRQSFSLKSRSRRAAQSFDSRNLFSSYIIVLFWSKIYLNCDIVRVIKKNNRVVKKSCVD